MFKNFLLNKVLKWIQRGKILHKSLKMSRQNNGKESSATKLKASWDLQLGKLNSHRINQNKKVFVINSLIRWQWSKNKEWKLLRRKLLYYWCNCLIDHYSGINHWWVPWPLQNFWMLFQASNAIQLCLWRFQRCKSSIKICY